MKPAIVLLICAFVLFAESFGNKSLFAENPYAESLHAQSLGETTGLNAMLGRPPTGADVLLGIHQFDLFEQGLPNTAGMRGNDAARDLADALFSAAEKRDDDLSMLNKSSGLNVNFPDQADLGVTNRLAGLQGAVGQTYLSDFYEDVAAEHETAISLLKRYLEKPDNEQIKSFSQNLLPVLQAGLKQANDQSK